MIEPTTNKDLVSRFTDIKYAKKDEVRKDLNTSLIDPIWNAITTYRSRYTRMTNLLDLSNAAFKICLNPGLLDLLNNLSSRLDKCLFNVMNLEQHELSKFSFIYNKKIITLLGEFYGEKFFDEVINSIVSKNIENMQFISEEKKKANNYFNLINNLSTNKIDIDFLVNLYISLSHNENIVSIYRTFDFNKQPNLYSIMEQNGVPFNRIEKMMDSLISFINESKLPNFVIASISYFYFQYIKPFDSFNDEIGIILFKNILASDNKEKISYLFPLEILLNKKSVLNIEIKEITRENDATYIVYKILEFTNLIIDEFLKDIEIIKAEGLEKEHLDNLKEAVTPTPSIDSDTFIKQEIKETEVVSTNKEIAIPHIETKLSEDEAKKLQRYLVEKNPYIKEEQAHFFAHHCTIGCYYTIQMYKAFEKVVYETARTSMDALAKFGYYRKEKIKNKFVYTPIKLEEK